MVNEDSPRILVADDSPVVRAVVRRDLEAAGYTVDDVADGGAALRRLEAECYDVVVTDLRMPELSGLELLAAIKGRRLGAEVVILTATHAKDMACAVQALRLGAHDYLTKPPASPDEIVLTVERALEKKRLRDANQRLVRELQALSLTDALTGLRNRRAFDEALRSEFDRAQRYGVPLSLAMVDLDHFKKINDGYGHAGGDEVLRCFAAMVPALMRTADAAFRYGGEEFAILFPHTALHGALDAVERLRADLERGPVAFGEASIHVTCSGGVACLAAEDAQPKDLLRRADAALYLSKQAGRNRIGVGALPRGTRRPPAAAALFQA